MSPSDLEGFSCGTPRCLRREDLMGPLDHEGAPACEIEHDGQPVPGAARLLLSGSLGRHLLDESMRRASATDHAKSCRLRNFFPTVSQRPPIEERFPRPSVMGVVNVTPDSFFDGGVNL